MLGADAGGAVCFVGAGCRAGGRLRRGGLCAGAAGRVAAVECRPEPVAGLPGPPFRREPFGVPPSWWVLKYCAQLGSTEPGSETYCSYISSSSQSLAPNSSARASVAVWVELDGSGTGATIAFFRRGLVGEGPCHREKRGPPASFS